MSGFKKRSIEAEGSMDILRDKSKEPGLWADVLADEDLTVAVRDECIHVYWLQQQLFELRVQNKNLRFTTHPKFLCDARISDPKVRGKVPFDNPHFRLPRWQQYEFFTEYVVGGETLQRMKRAAAMYAKHPEKRGVHAVARANPHVLDVEFRFDGKYSSGPGRVPTEDPQIDLVTLKRRDGKIEIAFWEAKHVINVRSLRHRGGQSVRDQIAIYRNAIMENRNDLLASLPTLANNLAAILRMRPEGHRLNSVIADAAGGTPLILSDPPSVGLLIIGEPAPSYDEPWLRRLCSTEDVLVCGNPEEVRLPA